MLKLEVLKRISIAIGVIISLLVFSDRAEALKYGDSSPEVREVQKILIQKKLFPDNIPTTEYYGKLTQQGVIDFQEQNGLKADGIVGQETYAKLKSRPTQDDKIRESIENLSLLSTGAKNEDVKKLQSLLKEKGYFNYQVTGYFGTITSLAVKNFQRDQGLKVDGIVGQQTWNLLLKLEAKVKVETKGELTTTSSNSLCRIINLDKQTSSIIRLNPSEEAEEIDLLKGGSEVEIKSVEETNGWIPLASGGYISAKHLTTCN
jgi:peptidoglycan hydrolase-like protein with peptidoglycan-binding domain